MKGIVCFVVFLGAMVKPAFLPGADVTTPVTAKYRYVIVTVDPSGRETIELEAERVYLRTSSGQSLMRHQPVRYGTQQPGGRGIYVDPRSGNTCLTSARRPPTSSRVRLSFQTTNTGNEPALMQWLRP